MLKFIISNFEMRSGVIFVDRATSLEVDCDVRMLSFHLGQKIYGIKNLWHGLVQGSYENALFSTGPSRSGQQQLG